MNYLVSINNQNYYNYQPNIQITRDDYSIDLKVINLAEEYQE